jgi:hypothetical protein
MPLGDFFVMVAFLTRDGLAYCLFSRRWIALLCSVALYTSAHEWMDGWVGGWLIAKFHLLLKVFSLGS